MRRYNILNGDTTNARGGGSVIGSATYFTNNGRALALIGDKVICRACGKTGKICPNGPRLKENVHGRDVALNGDLCLCDCKPPPKLIHSRTDMYQEIDTNEVIRQGFGSWVGIAPINPTADANEELEHYFEIVDARTEAAVEGMTYKLLSNGKSIVPDMMLASGKTRAFSLKDHPNLSFIAWRDGTVR